MSARYATATSINTREIAVYDHFRVMAACHRAVIAVIEPGRVRVLGLPHLHAIAELGIKDGADTVFLDDGTLSVLSRSGDSARLHVVDPTRTRFLRRNRRPEPRRPGRDQVSSTGTDANRWSQ